MELEQVLSQGWPLAWPDGFGWNLGTIQALGSIAVFGSLAFAWWAIDHTRRESSLRTRPWVGVKNAYFAPADGTEPNPVEYLVIEFHNVGLLPALSLELIDVSARSTPIGDEPAVGVILTFSPDVPPEAMLPTEPGTHRLSMEGEVLSRFIEWRDARREVVVTGAFRYRLGKQEYRTDFEIRQDFGAVDPRTSWFNKTAT